MASTKYSAKQYLINKRKDLVTGLKNSPLIIDNLYQKKVFTIHEVDEFKAVITECNKARFILDRVTDKGDAASYELLRIMDVTKKKTLSPDLHCWISWFGFPEEEEDASYMFGTKPCQDYQNQLKIKARNLLKDHWEHQQKYLKGEQDSFAFTHLVLETESAKKGPQCFIKCKNKKCKKLRPKKLKAYIPDEEEGLSPRDLLRWQEKNILLLGKPGIGKTIFVLEFLQLWAQKKDGDQDYMFYFDESAQAHSERMDSLESFLFDVYSKPKEKDRKEVFQDIEDNSENVVIVFDGLMELKKNSILWKIVKHELLPDAKIIITRRSVTENDSLLFKWPSREVYIQGFSEESIRKYYQRMLGHDPALLEIVLKNQELFSLSHVPMYAFMIVALIQFKTNSPSHHSHTVTEMYIHIFRVTMEKHSKKDIKLLDKYLMEKKDELHLLMKHAFDATKQKYLIHKDLPCEESHICQAFLKSITIKDTPTSTKTYSAFLHNTMQEFFSALWLLKRPEEIESVLQISDTVEHMRHVLPFLCGLLSEHSTTLIKSLFSEVEFQKSALWFVEKFLGAFLQPHCGSEELLYVCQCLYELQSPGACVMFLEKLNYQLELEPDIDPNQCCALAFVIAQSRDTKVWLNLEDYDISDSGMDLIHRCSTNLSVAAAENETAAGRSYLSLLSSVCTYRTFPFHQEWFNQYVYQSDFLLDLYSHMKSYESQTGRRLLPALQSVFQSPEVWIIDLSERKSSFLLEVMELQTEKKPVKLRRFTEDQSEVRSFLQCLLHISELRFAGGVLYDDDESRMSAVRFLLNLSVAAAENETAAGRSYLSLLSSVCTYRTFPFHQKWFNQYVYQSDFLLDLYSHMKSYESQTGRRLLPALQSVFQSPEVWIIDLSERKSSLLVEVLELQTEKKPVELRRFTEDQSEVRSFLQCLLHISELRFTDDVLYDDESRMSAVRFLLNLSVAAAENETAAGRSHSSLLSSVCTYRTFPFHQEWFDDDDDHHISQSDFLLDLCAHVKNYESQTGRRLLPALQSVFQSPEVWSIDLSERKSSLLVEVLELQTEKKPVELRRFTEDQSEVRSFLQCLLHISELRFAGGMLYDGGESRMSAVRFLLNLSVAAAENETAAGRSYLSLLSSVCTYRTFPFHQEWYNQYVYQSDFLLDLYSHMKSYESQTGRRLLPALQSVFQSPEVWIIDLSERKSSLLLEVLELQTEKKPVELRRFTEDQSEVRSFLQCLLHISELRFTAGVLKDDKSRMSAVRFLLNLSVAAAENETAAGRSYLSLLSSVCTYRTFPFHQEWFNQYVYQSDFLLDLYSHMKSYESQTGRRLLPALQSVFQSPEVWIIDLSERKSSLLLEVMELQTEKKPVELRRFTEDQSEVRSFLQCLLHISELRFAGGVLYDDDESRMSAVRFLLNLSVAAAENETASGRSHSSLLSSICTYRTFPLRHEWYDNDDHHISQSDFLLDLYSHMKSYESQTGRRLLPALLSVFQSPEVWIIDLSERKSSLLLEVMELQTEKKPVELRRFTEDQSEVRSFLQCLLHISELRKSKEISLQMIKYVYEVQEEELTRRFLQKVKGDLTCFPFTWEELHYFLLHTTEQITVDMRKSNIQCRVREIIPFLKWIQFKRMRASFLRSLIRGVCESGSSELVASLLRSVENHINLENTQLDSADCVALRFILQSCKGASLKLMWSSAPDEELKSFMPLLKHVLHLSVDRQLLLKMLHCCSSSDPELEESALLLSALQYKLDFSCCSAMDLTTNTQSQTLHLSNDDCFAASTVLQRANSHRKTQLILQDCEIHSAGMDQIFSVLSLVQLCCSKALLLQFLAHVSQEEAEALSQALGDEIDLSETQLSPQVCRGLLMVLEYSEGFSELDLSRCNLTDDILDLLLPSFHKAQNIDFSGNGITDVGAEKIYNLVCSCENIKTVRTAADDGRDAESADAALAAFLRSHVSGIQIIKYSPQDEASPD
ncbi:hypothetical protein DNTS_020603 [Danionella cerebrum]|uniref:NACHT domain-containing protein n=1 Tax=Danionella cerebrum TaxID=2873325 RepID=A0A553R553_9TELE|nr:hypothetical protein DNTS_020603 [Danionella translucida]